MRHYHARRRRQGEKLERGRPAHPGLQHQGNYRPAQLPLLFAGGCGYRETERALQEAAAVGRSEDNGWRVRKDGSTFWANVIMTAIRNSSGDLRGYATLERDMTERRRVEAELNAAKATAEAADQAESGISFQHEP